MILQQKVIAIYKKLLSKKKRMAMYILQNIQNYYIPSKIMRKSYSVA